MTERLLSIVANSAWVETQLQGQTIARTAVDWTGDMNSVCRESVNHQQVALHQHTIALALASQKTLLQTFSLAVQTAMKFSILMTMPGGLILVVPITWKFIHQIIANSSGGLTNEQL